MSKKQKFDNFDHFAQSDPLKRERIKVVLEWKKIAKLREACHELNDLEGCGPCIALGQARGMCGAAEEVGHRVVGECGVVGPA